MIQRYLTSILAAAAMTLSLAAGAVPNLPASPEVSLVTPSAQHVQDKLNLNSADAATLQRELSGIGKTKAEAIVAYRESNGDFASVDELLEVDGIGKTLLDRNRDKITVN